MNMRGKYPREKENIILKPLLNLCQFAVLHTTRKKIRGQVEVEIIINSSEHMEALL